MDKIVFTVHARIQLEERKMTEKSVLLCLANPGKIIFQGGNRHKALKTIKRLGKKYLMVVVFDQLDGLKEIVTAFYTSKIAKYL